MTARGNTLVAGDFNQRFFNRGATCSSASIMLRGQMAKRITTREPHALCR
jgi:hypothetical protein